jgi:outer membrane protein assembly factor BamA
MTTLTIDTNQVIKRLKVAGFTDKQADEIVETLTISQKDLVNREYLGSTKQK